MSRLIKSLMNGPVLVLVFFAMLFLGVATAWVANIVKLFGLASTTDPNLVMAILRAVGIFVVPLGVILGLM